MKGLLLIILVNTLKDCSPSTNVFSTWNKSAPDFKAFRHHESQNYQWLSRQTHAPVSYARKNRKSYTLDTKTEANYNPWSMFTNHRYDIKKSQKLYRTQHNSRKPQKLELVEGKQTSFRNQTLCLNLPGEKPGNVFVYALCCSDTPTKIKHYGDDNYYCTCGQCEKNTDKPSTVEPSHKITRKPCNVGSSTRTSVTEKPDNHDLPKYPNTGNNEYKTETITTTKRFRTKNPNRNETLCLNIPGEKPGISKDPTIGQLCCLDKSRKVKNYGDQMYCTCGRCLNHVPY